jgi:hypothetical protein
MAKTVIGYWAENCSTDMSSLGLDMSDFGGYIWKNCYICPVHPKTFFLTLILELQGTKLDETWTQGSPQYKEQVPKKVFPKSKHFPSDFG